MSTQTRDDLWDRFYTRCGPQSLDKMLTDGSDWNEVLKTGEADLARGLQYTTITFGEDRSALDLGCGAGRLTHVLGRRFGRVLGVDTSEGMIREAYKHRLLENTSFLVTDDRLNLPATVGTFDTIFSYEVFHYLTREQLKHYFRVAYSLLRPNGELVFQLNVQPIRATTRISFGLRSLMKLIGIDQWHGWPNDAAFQRKCHSPEWLSSQLAQTGFVVDGSRGTLRQTWVRAVRPATDH